MKNGKIADQQEINEEWENIKTTVIESAKEIIQYKKSLQRMNHGMKRADKPLYKRIQQE
jgi:hypothetical protein